MLAISVMQTYCVYRRIDFHHVRKCLYPGDDHCWRRWRPEIQDLECWMCLERITDGAPRFVAHPENPTKIQFNKTFVFSEGARNCKNFSVTDLRDVGKAWFQALQTTVSAQNICEDKIVNSTLNKLGRSLIASKDVCQSTCSSSRKLTADQLDIETWPRIGAKDTDVILSISRLFNDNIFRLWHCSIKYAKVVGALINTSALQLPNSTD
jgi:hypothetical protein